ncbi:MAG: hypothetical protein ABI212_09685 [Burkholderiaceae bacterium]
MLIVRGAFFLLLLAAAVCFGIYAATGDRRYRAAGLITFKWTLVTAIGFFAVLIVQRIFTEAG